MSKQQPPSTGSVSQRLWYFQDAHSARQGPIVDQKLAELIRKRDILPTTLVWTKGMESWLPAIAVKGLFPGAQVDKTEHEPPPLPDEPPNSTSSDTRRVQPSWPMQFTIAATFLLAGVATGLFLLAHFGRL